MLRLKHYFLPYKKLLILITLLIFIQAITTLFLPYLMSDIVDIGIQQYGIDSPDYLEQKQQLVADGQDIAALQNSYIIKIGAKMLIVSILSAISVIAVVFLSAKIASGVGKDLRKAVFSKIETFHNNEFDLFSSASLITRCTNDVMQIQNMLSIMIRIAFIAPLMAVGGLIMAFSKSISLSWTIAIAVIFILGLISLVFKLALPRFAKMQKLVDNLTQITRQTLSGIMVVRAFNTQDYEMEKFQTANQNLNDNSRYVSKIMVFVPAIMSLVLNLTALLIIWFGAKQIAVSQLQVGDMMAYIQFATMVIMSFLMMSMMFVLIPRASISANRIADVLETETVVNDSDDCQDLEDFQGQVRFEKVSFKYGENSEEALKNISFTAPKGQTTAIIGSTGAGKSTIMNLITRFYNLSGGQIYLDEKPIDQLCLHSIRANIGYVPQKTNLFKGTIKSNLLFANPQASDDEIEAVLKTSLAWEFVSEDNEGIDAIVSQKGSNFSGGQKQRLAIARALIKKPALYLFDDSFSALDFSTDKALRANLKTYSDSTIIVVAQRVASIKNAAQIIVLDEGKIVGKGKHQDLIKNCPTYQEIAYSQLSEEEING